MSVEIAPDSKLAQDAVSMSDVAVIPEQRQPKDEILAGLQDFYGQDALVENYDAYHRRYYSGSASEHIPYRRSLVATVAVRFRDEIKTIEHEIDDFHRPFGEELITRLGALAQSNPPSRGFRRWPNGYYPSS